MNEHDQRTYLEHIRAALERVADYTTQGKHAFLTSTLLQDAVLRNLEVVGEAVKRLAPEVRALALSDETSGSPRDGCRQQPMRRNRSQSS